MTKRPIRSRLRPMLGAVFALAIWHSSVQAADYANPRFLTETTQLQSIAGAPSVRVVDVRPRAAFDKGHITGAVHLGADDIIDPTSQIEGELLPYEVLVSMLEQKGIGNETRVVLYDDRGGFQASRLFWLLEYFGHRNVSILNGGFPKWKREGRSVSKAGRQINPQPAKFTLTRIPRKIATADWLLDRQTDPSVVVIDVRPAKMYKAGHIPWARNIPWSMNLNRDGTMKSAEVLLRHFAALGVTKEKNIAVHCQVGKAAAHSYFTLRLLGYSRVRSYDRSWAEWGSADDLPKAAGRRS